LLCRGKQRRFIKLIRLDDVRKLLISLFFLVEILKHHIYIDVFRQRLVANSFPGVFDVLVVSLFLAKLHADIGLIAFLSKDRTACRGQHHLAAHIHKQPDAIKDISLTVLNSIQELADSCFVRLDH
jgi:hypothetical protein